MLGISFSFLLSITIDTSDFSGYRVFQKIFAKSAEQMARSFDQPHATVSVRIVHT